LCDVAAAIAPRSVCLAEMVDGLNRRVSAEDVRSAYKLTAEAYRAAGAANRLEMLEESAGGAGRWLARQLK
jgi:hypothetical protein